MDCVLWTRGLFLLVALFCSSIFNTQAQPTVDIGLYNSGTDTLVVKLIPRGFFNGMVSNVVFTIRWETGCNTSLGSIIQTGAPSVYIPMVKSGAVRNSSGYSYQVFGGAGLQPLSSLGVSWSNGVPVTLLKVAVNNPKGTFEIINNSWTAGITNNANYFVSLNGLNKTGVISAGHYSFIQNRSLSICQGDSIFLGGAYRKIAGNYYDTLQGSGGCDSIVMTALTVKPASVTNRAAAICQGQSYYAGGAWQTASGIYYDRFPKPNGCDSVMSTNLTVHPVYSSARTVSICQGHSFFAGGAWRTTSGTYTDHYTSRFGCDSMVITQLTVHPGYVKHVYYYLCVGSSVIAGGDYQTQSGVFYDTLVSRSGCDSIIVTHLTIEETIHFSRDVTVCNDGGTFAGGGFQTVPGTYYDTFTAVLGCDSVVVTNLSVLPPLASTASVFICQGESYFAGGMLQTASGTYTDTLVSSLGCDSVVTTYLTVLPVFSSASSVQICGGETYFAGGANQNSSGIYYDTLTASNGCDSIVSTELTVLPASFENISVIMCEGNTWFAGGALRNTTGIYYDTLVAANGCDSILITQLTVLPRSGREIVAGICDGESYFAGGALRTASGTYYDTLLAASGCDSIVTTRLTVYPKKTSAITIALCEGDSYFAGGAPQTEAGTYYDTFATAHGCDSMVVTNIRVLPNSQSMTSVSICQGESYFAGGALQTTSGIYYDTLLSATGCDSIVTTHLTVNPLPAASVTQPGPICHGADVTLSASGGISYLWNTGDTSATITATPSATTAYIVSVTNESGCLATVSATVTVHALPVASVTPANVSICFGSAASLTAAGGTDYSWSTGETTSSISVSPESTSSYSVTVTNTYGCSASTSEPVNVNPLPSATVSPASVTVCSGTSVLLTAAGGISYSWNTGAVTADVTVNPSSTANYSVTVTDVNGCRASATRTVNVNPLPAASISPSGVTLCSGNSTTLTATGGISFLWNTGSSASAITVSPAANTVYTVTVTNVSGCTATASRTVTVNPLPAPSIFPLAVNICSGNTATLIAGGGTSYLWNTGSSATGIIVSPASSTTYSVTVTNSFGCSASASRLVNVNPVPAASIAPATASICNGQNITLTASGGTSYTWNTGSVSASISVRPSISTSYSVTVSNSSGCPAAASRSVTVYPKKFTTLNVSICEGAAHFAGGVFQTEAGTYYDTLSTLHGCDSIITTILTIEPTIYSYRNVMACPGTGIFAGGAIQTAEGTYYDTLVAHSICDSVVVTNLNYYVPAVTHIDASICSGEHYFAGGANQNTSGVYYDTLVSSHQCDSIVVTHLTVKSVFYSWRNISICQGESFYAGGSAHQTAGTYYDTLTALSGCDSIIITILSVKPVSTNDVFISICPGESYYAGGAWQTAAGSYTDVFTAANGCDSIVNTHLSILPHSYHTTYVSICEGDSLYTGGAYRKVSGIYRDTLIANTGCDSIVVTSLEVHHTVVQIRQVSICEGDSLFAGNGYQTVSGNYYDTLPGVLCDSVIITALSVLQAELIFVPVTICSNESYFAGGMLRNASGLYFDTIASSAGCDSIVVTLLEVLPSFLENVFVSVCEGDSIFAGGGYQKGSGTYIDTFKTGSGCDSIVITRLEVFPVPRDTVSMSICSGESYPAGGVLRTVSGTYYDTLSTLHGCDSIIVTLLTVNPVYSFSNQVFICPGDSAFAGGKFRHSTGIFSDTLQTISGCDSIVTTDLKWYPAHFKKLDIHICEGDSVFAGGRYRTEAGNYFDTLSNRFGCDSIIRTILVVEGNIIESADVSICRGDSVFAGGAFQQSSGIYYDTFAARGGCDSIIITHLSVIEADITTVSVQMCQGDSVFAGGGFQKHPGTFIDTFISSFGCDSMVIMQLSFLPVKHDSIEVSICQGENYFAGGALQSSSGIYYDTFSQLSGCDSIVTTFLTVKPAYSFTQQAFICSGDSLFAGGRFRRTAGIYHDTMIAANGCDSIRVTDLKIHPAYFKKVDVSICEDDSFFAGGAYQTIPGNYYDTLESRFGCDSIVRTSLLIESSIIETFDVSICDKDSFFAGGAYQNSAGTYYDTFSARGGCDSIIITNLSVSELPVTAIFVQLCAGDSIFAGGEYRKLGGIYFDTISSLDACDSILRTEVSVLPSFTDSALYRICNGQSVFVHGTWRNTGGTYYDTLIAANGCDSIIISVVQVMTTYNITVNVSICQGEKYFAGGAWRTTGGIYRDTFTSAFGCDSIVATKLKIIPDKTSYNPVKICSGQSYFAGGRYQTTPGIYIDTLTAVSGCDSIRLTILNVRPPATSTKVVTICDNEHYFVQGGYRNIPGAYRDTLQTTRGCDSIVTTILYVKESFFKERDVFVCSGDSIFLQGAYRSLPGQYTDTFMAGNLCDSVVVTNLRLKFPQYVADTVRMCAGDSLFAGGAYQTQSGIYYDTLTASNGCDSIIATCLEVVPLLTTVVIREICEGTGYFAGGALQTSAGTYYDTLISSAGCDSVVATELRMNPKRYTFIDTTICEGESYFAGGAMQTTAGVYSDTFVSQTGCDSVVSTTLTVIPLYLDFRYITICASETYFTGGAYQNTEGIYYDTLATAYGCDSIIITALQVLPVYTSSFYATICTHENYFAGGSYQNTSGVYYDTLSAVNGCDSIIRTELTVLPDFVSNQTVSICDGNGYFAEGKLQTMSGIYYDTLTSLNGCDSVIITQLNILPKSGTELNITLCFGDSLFVQGNWQKLSGTYYDSLWASNGCDSVVVTYLTILPQISDTLRAEICSNESYFAAGTLRDTSGVYLDILQAESGCDSFVTTVLTVLPVKHQSLYVDICSNESYFAGGAFRNTNGVYYDTLEASNGCDSVVTTILNVLNVSSSQVHVEICDGESYFAAGAFRDASGVYYDTLTGLNGCDSIVATHLSVLPAHVTPVAVSICDNEAYFAGGANQSASGIYYDTLTSRFGCDSVIVTGLTVLPSGIQTISMSICEGESYFAEGAFQTERGTYTDYFSDRNGCDSIIITNLDVLPEYLETRAITICNNNSIFLEGAYRNLPGIYYDTFTAATGCDSIVSTRLSIKPAYTVYQYYTICANESVFIGGQDRTVSGLYFDTLPAINGCDSVIVSELTVLPVASANFSYTICEGDSMFIAGAYRMSAGVYVDSLIAANGCDSLVGTSLMVNPAPAADAGRDETICRGDSALLTASGGDFYRWSTQDTSPRITISPWQTTSFSVIVTNSSGCTASDSVTVFVNPLPVTSFSGLDTDYCSDDHSVVTLTGNPSGGVFTGAVVSGNTFRPLGLAGSYQVSYTYLDSNGCQAISIQQVTIHPEPDVSINGLDSSYCDDSGMYFLRGIPAGGWFSGSGISGNAFIPGNAGIGIHQIVYDYISPMGCRGADTQYVKVLPLPLVNFEVTDSIYCISDERALLQASPPGGIFVGAGVADSFFYPGTAGMGVHNVAYNYTGSNGCTTEHIRSLQVRDNPNAGISPLPPGFCINSGAVILKGTPFGGLFIGDGFINTNTFSPQEAGVGIHTISYLYVDTFQCSDIAVASIEVYDKPEVSISGLESEYCIDAEAVYLSGSPAGGQFRGRGVVVDVFDPTICGAGGPFPIIYLYANNHGCIGTDTQWVKVNPLPILNISGNDSAFCLSSSAIELVASPGGGSFNGPGISGNMFNPSKAGVGWHDIIYSFTDSNSCTNNIVTNLLVELCDGIAAPISEEWEVFPNPFINRINLQAGFDDNSEVQVRLTDVLGQMVFKATFQLQPGINTISLKSLELLPSGVYHLEIIRREKMFVKRLVRN